MLPMGQPGELSQERRALGVTAGVAGIRRAWPGRDRQSEW